jgi:hypothetical protein
MFTEWISKTIVSKVTQERKHSLCFNKKIGMTCFYDCKIFVIIFLGWESLSIRGGVPGTFTHLRWSLVPPDFKECSIRYS